MKYKKKVLILEAGGAAAISSIKLLRKNKLLYLIAADMHPNAPGLYLADKALVIPPTSSTTFTSTFLAVIKKYNIDLILPCFEHGLKKLRTIRGNFITDFDAALRCKDKLLFSAQCEKLKIPVPKTELLSNIKRSEYFPKYIKPRFGVGSKENYIVSNRRELELLRRLIKDKGEFIAQDLLTGTHWNVDVLVENGTFLRAIPRRDIKQKEGNCIIVEVRDYQELIAFSKMVQKALSIKSVFNLEVFETKPKQFVINEVNVRLGGGVIFGALSNCDIVSYLATGNKRYLGKLIPATYSRYYEEVVSDPNKIIRDQQGQC